MTEKEQLIEAWTRNLEDNAEHQMHAIGLLTDEIDDNAASTPVVSAMLQKVTPQARVKRRRVMWAFILLAVLLSLFSLLSFLRMRSSVKVLNSLLNFGSSESIRVHTSTSEEERLLYGDLSRSTKADQRRALWEDEPKNPAYFAEYSLHFIAGKGVVPPDFLKITTEIDPDNAWFPAIAAATKAKDVCKKEKIIHPLSPVTPASISLAPFDERDMLRRNIVYQYSVVDAVGMQEVLDLWRQSLKLGTYNSYEIALQQKRYPILSQRSNYISYVPPMEYVYSHPHPLRQRYLCDVLAAALQQTDLRSDEGKQLMLDIEAYTHRLVATEPNSLIDILLTRATLTEIYKQIDVIDTSALDPNRVAEWKRRKKELQDLNKTLQQSHIHHHELLNRHASLLTSLALPLATKQTTSPPPLNVNDLKPMRYVDHCLFLSLLAIICSLLMVFLIPNHLWIPSRKMVHRISEEAWHSIRWRSLVMLVLLSVVAPLAYYTLLTLWTPLTGKHFSAGLGFIFPLYPAISVVLLFLLLPRLLVHRFIAPWQQLSFHRSHWYIRLGWIACLLPLLPLHLLTLFMKSNTHATVLFAMVGICWVPAILWLLWTLGRGLFAKGFYQAAMHGLRRRVVATCTISSIILLTVAYGVLYQCGSYWIQKDTLMAISEDKLSLTYEAEVIRQAHQDLLGIMKQQ